MAPDSISPLADEISSLIENSLNVTIGQFSSAGRKPTNQDFHGALLPSGTQRVIKGITLAIADGISTSQISHEAAETCVKSLMIDYYCTSDAWTVKTAASSVITATNSWLYAQNRRDRLSDMNYARVCTLSALILKGHHAHLFHVGDSRIWRLRSNKLALLTRDHRMEVSETQSYLARSMGSSDSVEIDYEIHTLCPKDIYILTTDGIHEFWDEEQIIRTLNGATNLDKAAEHIAHQALDRGSDDNLTIQIVRIDSLSSETQNSELVDDTISLPIPPLPKPGDEIDGFKVVRPLFSSARCHIFLATAPDGKKVALKFPSMDMRESEDYLRRFVMEEWIARRIKSPYVLAAAEIPQERSGLYIATEYIEAQTLRQWMTDNPEPSLEVVRNIVEQVVHGLRAFHRREMLHQDLRPENIMIDAQGTVKIIDFGSTHVAGVQEISPAYVDDDILGTVQYSAPEYFLGYGGNTNSDLYSLGVITYEMLTGKLPYGGKVSHVRTQKDLSKLRFKSTLETQNPLPDWLDFTLSKAVHLDTNKRYQNFSEFLRDLRRPSREFARRGEVPFIQKEPVKFWQTVSVILALSNLFLLFFK